ncbi:MAG: outer membrane protein transport protein [Prevotella sp.]|nr:outer membrane protein transport protein [Prevotella sp.]MCM1075097.1 outer membrane protein transport protein [Ruminococcus sp.]
MKRSLLISSALLFAATAFAQSALDGYHISQPGLYGTARFMSMGGAFGALGGDMTTLSFNPAGIGVYRSSEIGATINFDIQNTGLDFGNGKNSENHLNFLMNNGGYIGSAVMPTSTLRTFNWGFTYNRRANFNRRYKGFANNITNSMSNFMAGVANDYGLTEADFNTDYPYDSSLLPWIDVLAYDSYLISPIQYSDGTNWYGLYGDGTTGSSSIAVEETGGIDEYNLAFGGNFVDKFYWGMDFGIFDINYTRKAMYGESLQNAYVLEPNKPDFTITDAFWNLYNFYSVSGTGFNYKLGFIYKPIQELRIGFAFHTPTWYSLDEYYYASTKYEYPNTDIRNGSQETNEGFDGYNEYNLRTPWRFMFSAAGVIENKLIISADVDFTDNQYIHLSSPYYNGGYVDGYGDPFATTNQQVKDYYKSQITFRAGLEYRVSPYVSLRAGYAHISDPVKEAAKNNRMTITTAGTDPSYQLDNTTDYVTAGIGYHYKHFYMDAAYVYRHQSADWHAFTADPDYKIDSGAQAEMTNVNNQIVISMGFKF